MKRGAEKATDLFLDVIQRVRRVDGETDENNMGVGVAERPQTVIVFLTSSIPQGQLDVLAVNFDICHVVLEDGGNVDLRL